jgi:hypothetical protein
MPVYLRRSTTWAPAGTALLPDPTDVMRSPSITTTASFVTFVPSHSLPKRIAFACACATVANTSVIRRDAASRMA